jgi:hypothetical protein
MPRDPGMIESANEGIICMLTSANKGVDTDDSKNRTGALTALGTDSKNRRGDTLTRGSSCRTNGVRPTSTTIIRNGSYMTTAHCPYGIRRALNGHLRR